MRRSLAFLTAFITLVPSGILGQSNIDSNTFRLFYLGGQSNMDGYGYNSELPDSLNHTLDKVWIFHGNTAADGEPENGGIGTWQKLQPGHGTGFASDGSTNHYSDRFGIELSLAHQLQQLYPTDHIALIKYSKGGTSIDSMATRQFGCWEPDYQGNNGINQYDHFLATLRNAFAVSDINKDGQVDQLIPSGILWMQGESDADVSEEIATRYSANLKRLMDLIRASLRNNELPVVIGKISDSWNDKDGKVWDYGELVQYAQEKFVRTDKHAAIVRSTRYYKYSDPWHYDCEGYIDLGKEFAEALHRLTPEKK